MLDKSKVRLGIAPIAWTNDDMPDLGKENTFEQCVSEMALAGFTGSEVGGKYPADTKVLKKALDLRGIQICNQWFSSFLISKPFEETEKEFIKAAGFFFPNQISKGNWRFNFLRINEADFGFATFLYNIYRQIGYPLIGTN